MLHIYFLLSYFNYKINVYEYQQYFLVSLQLTIYLLPNFKFLFAAFKTLINSYIFDKSLPQINLNLTILCKVCIYMTFLNYINMLAILAYYVGIMLKAFAIYTLLL